MKKGKHEAGYIRHEDKPVQPNPAAASKSSPEFAYQAAKKAKNRRKGCLVVLLTFLIILAMLIIAGVIYWMNFVKPPDAGNNNSQIGSNGTSVIDGYDPMGDQEENPPENEEPQYTEEDVRGQSQSINITDAARKEDYFTMLVVGLDASEGLTDTIVVATFNVKEKTVAILNIPRDTLSTGKKNKIHKINAAYMQGGIERTIFEIENVIGFEIDRHVIVTYEAFKQLIDEIGGIEFYVPQDMYKNTGDMIIDLKEGQQHLDGEHALMYMRYRGYSNADLDRIKAQQGFYQAVIEKIARPSTILKLPGLASVVMENVKTDLTVGEMIWIGVNYASMDTEDIVYNTLPNTPQYIDNISYVIPNEAKILRLVNEYYNPYTTDITWLNLTSVPEETPEDDEPAPDDEETTDPNDGELDYPDEGDGGEEDDTPFWADDGEGDSGEEDPPFWANGDGDEPPIE